MPENVNWSAVWQSISDYMILVFHNMESKTALVNVTQKNGDIYVMERQSVYDPEKKSGIIIKVFRLLANCAQKFG